MKIILLIGCAAVIGGCAAPAAKPAGTGDIVAMPGVGDGLRAMVVEGKADVEQFFGESYARPFEVREFGTHAEMEAFAKEKWGAPELPCWAVAMGSGSGLVVMDPEVWKTEACEHERDSAEEVQRIIVHECVHVYHGQRGPDPEFERSDEMAWFVEGVAVWASGQLDEKRMGQAADVVEHGRGPRKLEEAWSGNARYAVCGSMAAYLGELVGRDGVLEMMSKGDTGEVLGVTGMSEEEFLKEWAGWVKAQRLAGAH